MLFCLMHLPYKKKEKERKKHIKTAGLPKVHHTLFSICPISHHGEMHLKG